MALPVFANKLGALKRAASAAAASTAAGRARGSGVIEGPDRIARIARPTSGQATQPAFSQQAEAGQYEAGEEGQEPIGGDGVTGQLARMPVGQITPRRPRRPF